MITHCGVFATTSNDIKDTIKGLELLQHRGQEGSGISFIDYNNKITTLKNNGLVNKSFSKYTYISSKHFIGHVRYSTSGKKDDYDLIQPLEICTKNEKIAFAYNGNIYMKKSSLPDSLFVQYYLQCLYN